MLPLTVPYPDIAIMQERLVLVKESQKHSPHVKNNRAHTSHLMPPCEQFCFESGSSKSVDYYRKQSTQDEKLSFRDTIGRD